ncbi:MAG TPA: diaminopimelate decarboxylase [Acholeplasma sp.]|jgi:diaminopimelate decarboxylase|nr:diaminopimelate decarboxylase [Acholeplasma sp.]
MKTVNTNIKNNELYIGKHSLKALALKYKTPLMVYDEEGVKTKIKLIKESFSSKKLKTKIIYASKAFIAPHLVDILNEEGLCADATSISDFELLEKANFPMERVFFQGNNKTEEEIKLALKLKINAFIVDSFSELKLIEKLAKTKVDTYFRINPYVKIDAHKHIQTANLDSKFGEGIDNAIWDDIIDFYNNSTHVVLKGLQVHLGSQIKEIDPYLEAIDKIAEFKKKLETKLKYKIKAFDLGGGFGVKYLKEDSKFPLKEGLKTIIKKLEELDFEIVAIEPGRSIVGTEAVTIYQCLKLKQSRYYNYCLVDGGMADNIRPALYDAKYSFACVNNVVSQEKEKYQVVGKFCESGDILGKDITLSKLKENDYIVTYTTGAYCYAMSSNYNGALRPAVLFVSSKGVKEVIRRETVEDYLAVFNFKGDK